MLTAGASFIFYRMKHNSLVFGKLIKQAGIGALAIVVAVAGTVCGQLGIAEKSNAEVDVCAEDSVDGISVEGVEFLLPVAENAFAPRMFNDFDAMIAAQNAMAEVTVEAAEDEEVEFISVEDEVTETEQIEAEEAEIVVNDVTEEITSTEIDVTETIVEETDDITLATDPNSAERGIELVEYASQFVGNSYVWGGSSLTEGADCSGFTMTLYGIYGIELPHSSLMQGNYGVAVDGIENAQAGDLIVYNGHVAIYMGDGQIIHAANSRLGICISGIDFMELVGIRRLL